MSGEIKAAANLKGQLSKYSGILSKRFNNSKHMLIKEMPYGIQASKIQLNRRRNCGCVKQIYLTRFHLLWCDGVRLAY